MDSKIDPSNHLVQISKVLALMISFPTQSNQIYEVSQISVSSLVPSDHWHWQLNYAGHRFRGNSICWCQKATGAEQPTLEP